MGLSLALFLLQQCRIWALDRLLCFATTRSLRAVLHIVSLHMRSSHHHCNIAGHRHFSMFTAAPCCAACLPPIHNSDECDEMRHRMAEMLDGWDSTQEVAAFSTGGDQEKAQGSSNYFLDSADKGMELLHKRYLQSPCSPIGSLSQAHLSCVACWSALQSRKCMHNHHHPQGDLCQNFATLYTIW